jgi:hypothetical protein
VAYREATRTRDEWVVETGWALYQHTALQPDIHLGPNMESC